MMPCARVEVAWQEAVVDGYRILYLISSLLFKVVTGLYLVQTCNGPL